MMPLKTLDDLNLRNKTVLLRVDYNVPMKEGKVLDDSRILKTLPTIRELLSKDASVILLTHFGRPNGLPDKAFSMLPLQQVLEHTLGEQVAFSPYPIERCTHAARITLLENLRFNPGEEANDMAFAQKLSSLGDIFVNDAFSVSHRAHASVDRITDFLPSYAGRLMEAEVKALTEGFNGAKRPITAIVAGSKISTKLTLLKNLQKNVDFLILGGGIANTFLKAQGINVAHSLVEESMLETARDILLSSDNKVFLPQDAVVTKSLEAPTNNMVVDIQNIPADYRIVDVGPKTVYAIDDILSRSKTVLWNGPLGVFEIPPYDQGTTAVAEKVAERVKRGELYAIAGGGETVAALSASDAGS
ncbi:MAG: phosphoglycerate kinase, partial [Alphaproteobacteria bacterium]|nr:phosphoglycerate kinase [Alphaproteobacteria bacterium]